MRKYDVAIVGAGPVGSVAALSFAQRGARVLVIEASKEPAPSAFGEWLHPPVVATLERLGISTTPAGPAYDSGRGFALFTADGGEPIVLPYPVGKFGAAIERSVLVGSLRAALARHDNVEYVEGARATRIEDAAFTAPRRGGAVPHLLTYERRVGGSLVASAPLVVGASGRVSVAHEALYPYVPYGRDASETTVSRTASLVLADIELPFEGFAHLFLGGIGPAMAYRIDARRARLSLDVPLFITPGPKAAAALWDGFRHALPNELLAPFRDALIRGAIEWSPSNVRPRQDYGGPGLALVGDAVGHHHWLTAIDVLLGVEDATTLAEASTSARGLAAWRRSRVRAARIPELLAIALYEVLADRSPESSAIRRAMIGMWRERPAERLRTMAYIGGLDREPLRFGVSCLATLATGARELVGRVRETRRLGPAPRIAADLGRRTAWLGLGALHLTDAIRREASLRGGRSLRDRYGAALKAIGERDVGPITPPARELDPALALARGVEALIAKQADDGSFEGEVVWCPMLAAQYAIAWTLMGQTLPEARRKNLLRHFEDTQLAGGAWGLHELSEPYLFVTTLVYVAARMLGVAADDPLLARAGEMIRSEGGAVGIPSWGKLWLALAGLYSWDGVSPVLPETWLLPRSLPLHPSRWYCHTRNIYAAMATLYGTRWSAPSRPELDAIRGALREELFPQGFDRVDWSTARTTLREAEIHTPWTLPLRAGYAALKALEPALPGRARDGVIVELRRHIRAEMRATQHTCISPVSGLLGILALTAADPHDADAALACERFEGWVWEDAEKGARVAGARSASWDTGFAAQALASAAPHTDVAEALSRADAFLETQQIRVAAAPLGDGHAADFFRLDPVGGYCFAGVWHGWPVSDCTAEAMLGRLGAGQAVSRADAAMAVDFILRTQGENGGFGSYEAPRVSFSLEWINPAEMFGDSMTEKPYVECTASCVAALAAIRSRFPELRRAEIDASIARAALRLRAQQRPDGAWPGMWGVHFIYGTMFGIRGLLAAGVPSTDPAIRAACDFLESRQRTDGGWGESHRSVLEDRWVEAEGGHAVQTAWALSALLEADHPRLPTLERAAQYLASVQLPSGEWPRQAPEGIFFHTALLEYELYRAYFPVWALGLYQSRIVAARLPKRTREETARHARAQA